MSEPSTDTSAATASGCAQATDMAMPAPLENPVMTTRCGSATRAATSSSTSARVKASSWGPVAPSRPSLKAGPSLSGIASTSPALRVAVTSPVWAANTRAVWNSPWKATTRGAGWSEGGTDSR